MANSTQVTVATGATPTRLAADAALGTDLAGGNTLVLFNAGTVTVYIGGSDVSTTNGFRALVAGSTLSIDVDSDLYGVVSGATAGAVDVLRVK